ncbi:MAG: methyltransferase domain-containing protein [Bryobacteraceae bacterium]
MRIALVFAFSLTAWPQAADYANSGYKTKEAREKIAATLGAHDREDTQKPRDLVEAMAIAPGMTVADIGTGVGFMLPYINDALGAGGAIIAEDIFPDFLDKAKARAKQNNLKNVTFIQGDTKDTKLPENSVDVALILDAYHHFDYPKEMLASIAKGLKSKGRLAIVEFYKEGFRDPKHIRFTEAELIAEIEANGFMKLSSSKLNDRQYLAMFLKK